MTVRFEGNVTISKYEYFQLRKAQAEISRLNAYGVDNWQWYGEAFQENDEDGYLGWSDECDEIEAEVEAMPNAPDCDEKDPHVCKENNGGSHSFSDVPVCVHCGYKL